MSASVVLKPHNPHFADLARAEHLRWQRVCGTYLVAFHHIGSTAVPRLVAKPVLDLMPVFRSLSDLDSLEPAICDLGFEWWGEFGLPGRRYCKNASRDPVLHVHCYAQASPEITRHIAFRDYLRAHPAEATAYADIKKRCAAAHTHDRYAYGDCKATWIGPAEQRALDWYAKTQGSAGP